MDRHNVNKDLGLTRTDYTKSDVTGSKNQKDNDCSFKGRKVSKVPAIYVTSLSDYLLDDEVDNNIYNHVIKSYKKDTVMPSVNGDFKYKLSDSQINEKVKQMIKSCENGHSLVICYKDVQTSSMLLWDPVNQNQSTQPLINMESWLILVLI